LVDFILFLEGCCIGFIGSFLTMVTCQVIFNFFVLLLLAGLKCCGPVLRVLAFTGQRTGS
jgi:hypothetical protein